MVTPAPKIIRAAIVGGLLQRPPPGIGDFPFTLNLRSDPEHFPPMRKPGSR